MVKFVGLIKVDTNKKLMFIINCFENIILPIYLHVLLF